MQGIRFSTGFFIWVVLLLLFCVKGITPLFASSNVFIPSTYIPITQKNLPEGTVLSMTSGIYTVCTGSYDMNVIGVITSHPAIKQEMQSAIPYYPLTSSGDSMMRVSTSNGPIHIGDFLVCSAHAGVAMKATASGMVVGIALADFSDTTMGEIPVTVLPHFEYIPGKNIFFNLFNFVRFKMHVANDVSLVSFKYTLACILIGLSLFITLVLVSKTASKGIEALGRNPLASVPIIIGMILNIGIAILVLFLGVCMSFVLFKL